MRVLVTGDRDWDKPFVIHTMLWGLAMQSWGKGQTLTVIQGGARGADKIASDWVDEMIENHLEVDKRTVPAHWRHTPECPEGCPEYCGKIAGPIRNGRMLREKPQLVVAFHDNLADSRGTKDMVNKAKSAGLPVIHVRRVE